MFVCFWQKKWLSLVGEDSNMGFIVSLVLYVVQVICFEDVCQVCLVVGMRMDEVIWWFVEGWYVGVFL